jgi:hypothetical protein
LGINIDLRVLKSVTELAVFSRVVGRRRSPSTMLLPSGTGKMARRRAILTRKRGRRKLGLMPRVATLKGIRALEDLEL